MKVNSKNSSFQSVILEIIRQKLNCMLTETFQLKKMVDFQNYEKLTKVVLKEIAACGIRSAHMSTEDAKKAIALLETMDCHRVMEKGSAVEEGRKKLPVHDNPFANSPFN